MADPVFVVKFENGLADRHRLPLAHVTAVLEEIRQMISAVGREFQRQHGNPEPTGDFGLELLAGRDGVVFKKGSLQAHVAITRDIQNGMWAADSILKAVTSMATGKSGLGIQPQDPVQQKIVRHLKKIADIEQRDHTQLRLSLRRPAVNGQIEKRPKTATAVVGEQVFQTLKAAKLPDFTTEHLTLYGKLFELKDKNRDKDSNRFWGELRLDNGEIWRIPFDSHKHTGISDLFRKQVQVTGRAFYYAAYPPKLVPDASFGIVEDEERDYEAAFDELFGSAKDQLGDNLEALLREMHGE